MTPAQAIQINEAFHVFLKIEELLLHFNAVLIFFSFLNFCFETISSDKTIHILHCTYCQHRTLPSMVLPLHATPLTGVKVTPPVD